jgi:hypothetical protein
MLPILLGYYSPQGAILVSPLFFGVAHFHHMIERIRKGVDVQTAFFISAFQVGNIDRTGSGPDLSPMFWVRAFVNLTFLILFIDSVKNKLYYGTIPSYLLFAHSR